MVPRVEKAFGAALLQFMAHAGAALGSWTTNLTQDDEPGPLVVKQTWTSDSGKVRHSV